ncbi:consensus disorder prediction [Desulfoluna spongiiphila]|nr:consensus disorder prediction [Desulfoluna spongiiphila]
MDKAITTTRLYHEAGFRKPEKSPHRYLGSISCRIPRPPSRNTSRTQKPSATFSPYGHKKVRSQDELRATTRHDAEILPDLSCINARLCPHQIEGDRFALHMPAALTENEMGCSKTLQTITLASLKEQWTREIERFTDKPALAVSGPASQHRRICVEGPT